MDKGSAISDAERSACGTQAKDAANGDAFAFALDRTIADAID